MAAVDVKSSLEKKISDLIPEFLVHKWESLKRRRDENEPKFRAEKKRLENEFVSCMVGNEISFFLVR